MVWSRGNKDSVPASAQKRRAAVEQSGELDALFREWAATQRGSLDVVEICEELERGLSRLPELDRTVVLSKKVYKMQNKEIAVELGISLDQVRRSFTDGMALLKEHLKRNAGMGT